MEDDGGERSSIVVGLIENRAKEVKLARSLFHLSIFPAHFLRFVCFPIKRRKMKENGDSKFKKRSIWTCVNCLLRLIELSQHFPTFRMSSNYHVARIVYELHYTSFNF